MSAAERRAAAVSLFVAACGTTPPTTTAPAEPAATATATDPTPVPSADVAPGPDPTPAQAPDAGIPSDVAPAASTPPSEDVRCSVDADCTLSTFECNVCPPCPRRPTAMSVAHLKQLQTRCEQRQAEARRANPDPPKPKCRPCPRVAPGEAQTWPKAAACVRGACTRAD